MLHLSETTRHQDAASRTPGPPEGCGSVQIATTHDEAFHGTTATNRFGQVRLSLVQGPPHELIRPRQLPHPQSEAVLRLLCPSVGEVWAFQDGRHSVAASPQLVCLDTTRPYKVVLPRDYRLVEAVLPHQAMALTPQDAQQLTARPWAGDQGIAALVHGLLGGLEQHADEVGTCVDLLGGSMVALSAALFSERMRDVADAGDIARQAMMLRVQAQIRDQLADPDLCPAALARSSNVSLRYLQKMFQDLGTSPARWIRDQRLDHCRSELDDSGLDHLPVAVIGERAGLYGASHFSRLFRDRYGVTPRRYRQERTPA